MVDRTLKTPRNQLRELAENFGTLTQEEQQTFLKLMEKETTEESDVIRVLKSMGIQPERFEAMRQDVNARLQAVLSSNGKDGAGKKKAQSTVASITEVDAHALLEAKMANIEKRQTTIEGMMQRMIAISEENRQLLSAILAKDQEPMKGKVPFLLQPNEQGEVGVSFHIQQSSEGPVVPTEDPKPESSEHKKKARKTR